MEEKNVTKISLSTFLLIIAIIIIIIMGVFIYKLNNDKTTEIQKSTELQSQVNSLSGTVSDLQSSISKTINTTNSNENNLSTKKSIEYQISGSYYQKNAQGDEPNYTFSANNEVTYGALWTCTGTYSINNNIIKINFSSAVDPDGNNANVKDLGVKESVELTIIDDNNLKDNSEGIIYSKKLETNSSTTYQITGTYHQKNGQGDEPNYTFSANNKVTYGALWTCIGKYSINNNIIKINFTSAVDPDGNNANIKDLGVKESVELTIIDNNNLKDNSDGVIYSK